MHNETIFNSLRDNAAYGIIEVIPRLLLKKDVPLGVDSEPEELPGAKNITSTGLIALKLIVNVCDAPSKGPIV